MADHASVTTQKQKCPEEETAVGTCPNGCGFFGAAATGGMCSKCYAEHVVSAGANIKNAAKTVFIGPVASTAPPQINDKIIAAADSAEVDASGPSVKQPALAANRCVTCRKKVGLLGSGAVAKGRSAACTACYSDRHECGFDYKSCYNTR